MSHFGIAALQLSLRGDDNLKQIEAEIASACTRFPWVEMVVLGELCHFGAAIGRAQCLPGAAEQSLCRIARSHDIWLVPGTLYEQHAEGVFNTAPVIDPSGKVVGRYRKIFPFLPYEQRVTPGNEFLVFDVPAVGRFGLSICYDMWFPETIRSLCWLGAEVILHPTMTTTIDRDIELAIARANAATNQCYFLDVCVAGEFGNGRSIVCGPGGEVIHQAGEGREVIALDIDVDYVRHTRERGWHGLGQPLKSFRDSKVIYPAYGAGSAASTALTNYGPLKLPERDQRS